MIWSDRGRRRRDELGAGEGHVTLTDEAGLVIAVAVLMRRAEARGMSLGHVFAFDIETVPDVEFGRRLHGLEGLSDKQVGYVMQTRQRELDGLGVPVARAAARSWRSRSRCVPATGFEPGAWARSDTPESELVQRFFDGIGRYSPVLVSWNGSAFDLPVLTYRALRHQRAGAALLGNGRRRPELPLQQLPGPLSLAAYRPDGRAVRATRGAVASVSTAWRSCSVCRARSACPAMPSGTRGSAGRAAEIRDYCETDVINTYLIYLRFELLRGRLTREEHVRECGLVRAWLQASDKPHLIRFRDAWPAT